MVILRPRHTTSTWMIEKLRFRKIESDHCCIFFYAHASTPFAMIRPFGRCVI